MRQFIRHPTDVPIEVHNDSDPCYAAQHLHNVSFGGLEFLSEISMEPESIVKLRIACLQPTFEIVAARVAWCRHFGHYYAVGIQFTDSDEAFRVRMVEQICHIESYRHDVEQHDKRQLSFEEAAMEWIGRYGPDFPNP